jgi:hypothetical protein
MKEKIIKVLGNLDKGTYHAAREHDNGPRASYGFMTDLLLAEGIGPTQQEIDQRVKRLLVRSGIKTSVENIGEAHRCKLEQYAADTWGLEKLLAERGIHTKGAASDRLEKFFASASDTVLFPAYIESQIMMGMLAEPLLSDLVAMEANIDSDTYKGLRWTDTEADQELKIVVEGAVLPVTKITTSEGVITLGKFGRLLEASYEAIRRQRINVFSLMLQRIGQRIALDETDWAIQVLLAGDGNANSAAVDTDADVDGTLDYDELVKLFGAFTTGYTMTTAVAKWTQLRTILNMAEFKDPMAGFSFQRTGALPGPMGATWHRWDSTRAPLYNEAGHTRILAVDNRYALEQVTEQGVLTESDNLIDRQLNRSAISKVTGFYKLDYAATQCFDLNA